MKRQAAIGACVVMVVASAIGAQTRPDFSGVWKPVDGAGATAPAPPPPPPAPPGGGPPPPPPPPRVLAVTITQSATGMRVQRRADAGGREVVYDFAYKLDGAESVNQMGSILFRTKATWEGGTLVLSSAVSAGEKALGQLKEVYSLEDGALVVETARQMPAGTSTSRTVHRKE